MAFPTSPTNGQITVVNNVSYQYSNVSNAWTRILSTANIITANTLVSNGYISAAGNILTGNYFIGNGSQLTGIATGTPTQIVSGTSNVSVVSSGGNVTVGIGGTSNVAVFATTGEYVTGIVSASGNIISAANVTGGNLLTAGLVSVTGTLSVSGVTTLANLSAGNISSGGINSGGAISAAGNITGGNLLTGGLISAAGNVTGGNLLTGGLISATGNITGNYFLGNGSALTGITPGGTTTFGNTAPVSPAIGDVWIQANTAVQYIYFNDTTSNQWAEMEAFQSFSSGGSSSSSFTWNIANSNATMSASNGYFVDTSGGAKTMTLPASAVIGDTVRINDLAGTFGANNLTVARNSSNIQGVAQDLLVSVDQSSFGLVYSNSTYGWKLLEL